MLTRELSSGVVVGGTVVHGRPRQQSPGINLEIWIESGQRSLPWRVAVTFTDRPTFPHVLVEFLTWNLHPRLKSGDFAFRKPADARELPFLSMIVWRRSRRRCNDRQLNG
jgi:hypothetical protein